MATNVERVLPETVATEDVLPLLAPWQLAAAQVIAFHRRHGYYPARGEVVAMVKQQIGIEVSLSTARRARRSLTTRRSARSSIAH